MYNDRLPVDYQIEVALKPGEWREVASSTSRLPQGVDMLDEEILGKAVPEAADRERVDALIFAIEELSKNALRKQRRRGSTAVSL